MDKPFWENTYQNYSISTFGIKPNISIEKYYKSFKKESTILEVGCGEGKNAIFLTQNGHKVDAFDISENAINKLNKLSQINNVIINSWVEDLCNFSFKKQYDVITSHGTLHFVSKECWKKFIFKAKQNTNNLGFHIIQIFTDKIPPSEDIAPFVKGLSNEGELKELYNDWKIIEFLQYEFEDEHPGVEKHYHSSNKIIAQKQ